jgi:hypothetical protein
LYCLELDAERLAEEQRGSFLKNNPMLLHKILRKLIYLLYYTRRYTHLIGIVWHGMAPKKGVENRVA